MDETYVGGKLANMHHDKKVKQKEKYNYGKATVFGMVERGGSVKAISIEKAHFDTITPIVLDSVKDSARVYSDEHMSYRYLRRTFEHFVIEHGRKQYVKDGHIYTNTIEGFWSLLKRGIIGIYHFVSHKHLDKYLNEFAFRYNARNELTQVRFNALLANTEHRLKYNTLIGK